jgi:hypothetical protein
MAQFAIAFKAFSHLSLVAAQNHRCQFLQQTEFCGDVLTGFVALVPFHAQFRWRLGK